jgi:hypothetical protein
VPWMVKPPVRLRASQLSLLLLLLLLLLQLP